MSEILESFTCFQCPPDADDPHFEDEEDVVEHMVNEHDEDEEEVREQIEMLKEDF